MASPAKIGQKQPAVLPADFNEWDGGEIPATLPDNFSDFDVVDYSHTPAEQPVRPAAKQASVRGTLDVSSKSMFSQSASGNAGTMFQSLGGVKAGVEEEDGKRKPKAKVMVASIGAVVILLILISLIHSKLSSKPGPQKQAVTQETQALSTTGETKTSASTPTSASPTTTDTTPSSHVKSDMMNKQLNAPSRIPKDLRKGADQEAPSSGVGGMEALGGNSGAIGNVFGSRSVSKAPQKVSISAGVAVGLLMRKTTPVYPAIAKATRISGTVVVQGTISKSGTIEGARAINGPTVLRQAALDAVKTWRYKPYLLDNQPVAADTTVSVVFSLDGR